MAEIISCMIVRNKKRLRRSSVPPWETKRLAPFDHTNGPPGWDSWIDYRRQRGTPQGYIDVGSSQLRGNIEWKKKQGRLASYRMNNLGAIQLVVILQHPMVA